MVAEPAGILPLEDFKYTINDAYELEEYLYFFLGIH